MNRIDTDFIVTTTFYCSMCSNPAPIKIMGYKGVCPKCRTEYWVEISSIDSPQEIVEKWSNRKYEAQQQEMNKNGYYYNYVLGSENYASVANEQFMELLLRVEDAVKSNDDINDVKNFAFMRWNQLTQEYPSASDTDAKEVFWNHLASILSYGVNELYNDYESQYLITKGTNI